MLLRVHFACSLGNVQKFHSYRSCKWLSSKVPSEPTWTTIDEALLPRETVIDRAMIDHLERLSLVDFGNQAGIDRLSKAIRFADQMSLVDTSNVEPMTSVLENRALYLRHDEVVETDVKEKLLQLARKSVEDYYVSPPGNIPLDRKKTGQCAGSGVDELKELFSRNEVT